MNLKQRAKAEEIALVALGLDRAEREAYLRLRAAGDPQVLAEVRRRLELADEIPEGFLERPATELIGGSEDPTRSRTPWDRPARPAAAAAELREPPVTAGRRYRLGEPLGAGGMGVVFRAFDLRLERPVAVKRLRYALAEDPQALKRLEREARAAARVSHPAIVQVFDVLQDRDDLWIVMELVPGESLASRLAEGPLDLGEALFLAADVADGLAAAHAQGIVHRDLKAANVMVTPEGRAAAGRAAAGRAAAGRAAAGRAAAGRAKILDFGLARTVSATADDRLTADGELRGTPDAMSPEQVSLSALDARSDLFSFGVLLYQMVTGESPFAGSSPVVTLERVCRFRPPPASRLNPRVPEELSSLIETLLEKDPDRRPQDTAAVARTLARLAESATGAARRSHRRELPPDAADCALPSAAAECRQATVLKCQLVAADGSGKLLEPEEVLEIAGPFRDIAAPILERCRACLGEWRDGGLEAYFGIPWAQEDDPQRGVSAALELTAAVERWSVDSGRDPAVSLRVGVHTGPVVVTIGPEGRRDLLLGRTGSCAAEMRLRTRPGAVLVSAATHRLVRGGFRCESLGICGLRCCQEPHEIYRVLAGPAGSEDDAAVELTPFLGREAELALLRQLWRQAGEGPGRAVLVSGEAGSGKSRLVGAVRRLLAAETGTWLEVSCRPATSPAPLVRRLGRALGCEGEEEPGVLVRRLVERSEKGAAVLAIEDVHLADTSDLELLSLLIDQTPAARLLILLTCRTPFDMPWKLSLHLAACSLGPLTACQVKRMIRHLTAGRALPDAVEEQILAAADGVPWFVEELTRTLPGSASWSEGAERVGPLPPMVVPASLRSWLTARLDRLGSAREVARVASVLGREFTAEQLSALVPSAGDAVERALERLVEVEVLKRRGGRRGATYRFRLALDRYAAYESLIGEHRRLYERRATAARAGDEQSSSSSSRAERRSGSSAPSVNQP